VPACSCRRSGEKANEIAGPNVNAVRRGTFPVGPVIRRTAFVDNGVPWARGPASGSEAGARMISASSSAVRTTSADAFHYGPALPPFVW
jgi:hypothetical protein